MSNLERTMNPRVFRTLVAAMTAALLNVSANVSFAQPSMEPAPVPPEVAIARPSPSEVDHARESLRKFLETADPATQAIVKKYPDLIVVQPPRTNTAIIPYLARGFRNKHAANVELAKKDDIDVLFMGDSITDFWRNSSGSRAGKPVFDKYYGDMKVANFGISGDTTEGVLYRLRDGEGQGFKPKVVMLMIGTNNTNPGRNTAPEIAEGIGAVVLELRKDFPDAKILLLAVFPRDDRPERATIDQINRIISKLNDGKHVFYLDIGAKFLDADGKIPRDVMSDGLHPTTKGYEIWAEAVKQPLEKLLQD